MPNKGDTVVYHTLVGFNKIEWESVFTEYDGKKLDEMFYDYFNEMLDVVKVREGNDDKTVNVIPLDSYRSKDHEAFHLKGLGDSYEKLGNLNLFMQCKYLRPNAYWLLPKDDFLGVQYTKANEALLTAALSREISEF